jgi:DNA polymerase III epsilon subunit-like protein
MRHILSKNNIMVDLETMGNGSRSAIVAIGAVKFGEKVGESFYRNVSLQSSIDAGLELNADTVLWWMRQGDEAQRALTLNPQSLPKALHEFSSWVGKSPKIWGCGATFDNVILSNAYEAVGMQRPWGYVSDMCYRTIKNLYPDNKLVRTGVYHKADDDARCQAEHLISIIKENS